MYSKYIFSEYARTWLDDREFIEAYDRLCPSNRRSADRKFLLRSLLSLIEDVPGDTAECGVYQGASSYVICRYSMGPERTHHAFDSFEGLSEPDRVDGNYWTSGDLSSSEESARRNLAQFPRVQLHKGWIPASFSVVPEGTKFAFVHLDVDLHQPTFDSLRYFYPLLSPGAVVVCDDYGFATCPGTTLACDEFLADKKENIVNSPTGQGFFIKA